MTDFIYHTHLFTYIKPAITSRGAYTEKTVGVLEWIENGFSSHGEISPLPDLSIDAGADFNSAISFALEHWRQHADLKLLLSEIRHLPSLQFALECCWLGMNSGSSVLFDTAFTRAETSIAINGLVWMASPEEMLDAAIKKVHEGYKVIKFKIGALDHDSECRMLEEFRKNKTAKNAEVRLDANGAYHFDDALKMLKDFTRFQVHSIEQPIRQGNWDAMAEICSKSSIPVALDEELIGINEELEGQHLMKIIRPAFLVLKPTLLGGFSRCNNWIRLAGKYETGWWATSALESNLGLGHIAQWVSTHPNLMPQGLGTGRLYTHNFSSGVSLKQERMWFTKSVAPLQII